MNKIKIISTSSLDLPQSLQNIDISYGVSYFSPQERELKTVNTSNSWGLNVLSKVDKFFKIFNSKEQKEANSSIINQILSDAEFISNHQKEAAKSLQIQINEETKLTKTFKAISENAQILNFDHIVTGMNNEAGHIFSDSKKMFLGLDLFKPDNLFFNNLTRKMTKEEAVSFVFFHEYSHAAELVNNSNHGKERTDSSLDKLYPNSILLSNPSFFSELFKKLKSEDNLVSLPSEQLIKTLNSLHKEIYADVGALLILRNKAILNSSFDSEYFKNTVEHISDVRKVEKRHTNELHTQNNPNQDHSFLTHTHFTSPGTDELLNYLQKITQGKSQDTLLTEEEIHKISSQCVRDGVSKTILTLIEADNSLVPQFNTLFSVRKNGTTINIDTSENHYFNAINKAKEITSNEWQKSLKENVSKVGLIPDIKWLKQKNHCIFDAGLDPEQLLKTLEKHSHLMGEIDKLFTPTPPVTKTHQTDFSDLNMFDFGDGISVNDPTKVKNNIASLRHKLLNNQDVKKRPQI